MHSDNERQYFLSTAKQHTDPLRKLDYSHPSRQSARFKGILDALQHVDGVESVLDVGCGFGDFYPWATAHWPSLKDYYGIDIIPEFVQGARDKYEGASWTVNTVADLPVEEAYDVAIAIGMFTKKTEGWSDLLMRTIGGMWVRARKAVAFTTLSSNMWKPRDIDATISPQDLMKLIGPGDNSFSMHRVEPPYVNITAIFK